MYETDDNEQFTLLENEAIGHNISMFRKMRGIKAFDMAARLGMKEAGYTKYERGETKITIEFVQKVAEELKVDPFKLLTTSPNNIIQNLTNSPFAINGTLTTTDKHQTEMIEKLIENVLEMNKQILKLLQSK